MQMFPQRVMDHPEIFLNLKCNLTFATDTEIRDLMKRHYIFEQLVYPDPDSMALALQLKADEIGEYYNKLAYMRELAEDINPLYNYDRTSEIVESNTGKADQVSDTDTMYSEFPMNTVGKKNVSDTKGKATSTGTSDNKRDYKEHTYGNIGVQTLGDIVESSADKLYTLYLLKQKYVLEFSDLFMLTV